MTQLEQALNDGYSKYGICALVRLDCDLSYREVSRMTSQIATRLGYYSGQRDWPIDCPVTAVDPVTAYMQADNKFDRTDPYCQRRIEIAKIIIEEYYNEQ